MENNDILIRLRYALDLRDQEMVEIFKLGGYEVTKDDVLEMLSKAEDRKKCDDRLIESFLNGLITYKRGKQEQKPGQTNESAPQQKDHVNNMLIKKVKIALSLTSEDIIAILERAEVRISKSELGAILRKPGHRNYKVCGDKYARNFLKGLTLKYRG